jgi:hypothetical protein
MGESRGTSEDLVRLDVCHAVEGWGGIRFTDGDLNGWRTVGDVHRSILVRLAEPRTPGRHATPLTLLAG